MAVPRLLWRVVENATLDTLRGESRGQYHIALGHPAGIDAFFAGLQQTPKELQGFIVDVPLEAAPGAPPLAAADLAVVFNGWQAERKEWRIPRQRPRTAYGLWRPGVGPQQNTTPGSDAIVLIRDEHSRFHARWLTAAQRAQLPASLQQALASQETGASIMNSAELAAVRVTAAIPAVPPAAPPVAPLPQPPATLGIPYQRVAPASSDPALPFTIDPDVSDRGTKAHADTQNALSDHVQACGLVPRSPGSSEPPYDLGWSREDTFFVAEVKSLTAENEERQLRLGLGQLLRYAHVLRAGGIDPVQPVLISEREPADHTWLSTCSSLGVIFAWPATFGESLGR